MTDYRTEGVTSEDSDIEVAIETSGEPEEHAEKVHMHAHDAAVRAIQAFEEEQPPEECDGLGMSVAWERIFAGETGGKEPVTDGGEAIKDRDVSLGEPGEVTVEYSDADGDGFSEEFPLEPGSAMVIEGPDGFMQTYRVPEEVGDD